MQTARTEDHALGRRKKGEGLMRRLEVSADPVVMLDAALQEAAKNADVELTVEDGVDLPELLIRQRAVNAAPARMHHPPASVSTSATLARLKSPGMVCFNALAATAKRSAASCDVR